MTEISLKLINEQNRDEFLKREILKINLNLPASVYIPFVNGITINYFYSFLTDSIRNYAVLHIVTGEAKVF